MHGRTEELFPAAVDEWQQHFAAVLQVGLGALMHPFHIGNMPGIACVLSEGQPNAESAALP